MRGQSEKTSARCNSLCGLSGLLGGLLCFLHCSFVLGANFVGDALVLSPKVGQVHQSQLLLLR